MTNHLWQSTLFALAASLMALGLRRNRAQVRYWVWFSASMKFLIPFWLLIHLGSLASAPSGRIAPPTVVSMAAEEIAQPFPAAVAWAPEGHRGMDWAPIAIFGVWASGFAAVLLMRLSGWRRIRAAVRASRRIDIPAAIEVRDAPGSWEPGVVGFWRPILLLPAGIVERLTEAQMAALLAHELCHVRRRDNFFAAIHMAIEALFWFHPMVWWIGARLIEERERACDEAVLSLGADPEVYAEGILNVCKAYAESPLSCVSGVTGSDLKRRIHQILARRVANPTFAHGVVPTARIGDRGAQVLRHQ